MDVREKLVELLAKYFDIGDSYAYNLTRVKSAFACGTMGFDDFEEFDEETVFDIADYLISNGVTVQEWIPQTELPWMGEEIAKLCIRYMEDYADFHGYKSSPKVKAHIVRLLELEKGGRIAILPQPPKGE